MLDVNKVKGHEDISRKVLKACACSLSEPMSVLFSKCLETATLPVIWKIHKITTMTKHNLATKGQFHFFQSAGTSSVQYKY